MLETRLLPLGQLSDIVFDEDAPLGDRQDVIEVCTVMDILELAEDWRKRGNRSQDAEFYTRLSTRLKTRGVTILKLDLDRLAVTLFKDIRTNAVQFWDGATDTSVSTAKTIRRLTLRITDDSAWWPSEIVEDMESRPCRER